MVEIFIDFLAFLGILVMGFILMLVIYGLCVFVRAMINEWKKDKK